jgi:hypothetical protein
MPNLTVTEDRIRARAYELWEAEGCPDGCADRHWEEASRELAGQAATVQPTAPRAAQRDAGMTGRFPFRTPS